jgi:hypothetical protein
MSLFYHANRRRSTARSQEFLRVEALAPAPEIHESRLDETAMTARPGREALSPGAETR